jgi:site-specific DNA recombinase
LKIDGYIRVSRVNGRGGENFISPRVQREKVQAFAKLHGHKVVAWHEDLDEPGSKNSRPGFQAAIERVEAGKTDGIAVAKLDRFARSVADAAAAIRRIRDAGGELLSVEDNFDSSTPMGKFAMHMLLALGELELDRIRESWSTAQQLAVERGVHIASRAPTGYGRGKDKRLEPVKRDAAVVADVFRRRASGLSYSELARLLESKKVVGPYGNEHWTTAAVAKLLANRAYLGEARSGRFVKKDAHAALISEQEWQAAQGARSVAPLRSGEGAILAGLLRCAGCRYVMKPDTMRNHKGETLRMYRCRGDHAAGRCPERSAVLGHLIEPYVEEQYLAALGPTGVLARNEPVCRDVKTAHQVLEQAERELEAWVQEPGLLSLDRDLYLRGLESRQAACDQARETLAALSGPEDGLEIPDQVELRKVWSSLPVDERRRFLAGGIDAVMLRQGRILDERALVLFRGEAPADLPSRGRRVPLASFAWPDDRPEAVGIAAA